MFGDEITFSIRNVLLLQLLALVVAPDYAFQVHQKLLKIWKSLNTPMLPKKPAGPKKREKFWEIDMTKFEP
ncbi:MAG: hypothetical protein ACM3MD_01455 [Betaproteobacteria bacterium]